MANQYINKVILGEETLIDISDTQAVASDVLSGKKFYLKSGQPATGTWTQVALDQVFQDGVDYKMA